MAQTDRATESSKRIGRFKVASTIVYAVTFLFIAYFFYTGYGGLVEGNVSISKQLFIIMSIFALILIVVHGVILLKYRRLWALRMIAIVLLMTALVLLQAAVGLSFEDKIVW